MTKLASHLTTADVALAIGRATRTVRKIATRIGVGDYHGHLLMFTPRDLEQIRKAAHDGPGRPKTATS